MKKYVTKKYIIIAISIIVLIIIISAIRNSNKPITDGQIVSNLAALTTIPDVSIDVPQIYRIDTTQKQQPFFNGAQDGDVAILFLRSQKAYVYSPKRNMVVNSGPIENLDSKKQAQVEPVKQPATSTATTTKKK